MTLDKEADLEDQLQVETLQEDKDVDQSINRFVSFEQS